MPEQQFNKLSYLFGYAVAIIAPIIIDHDVRELKYFSYLLAVWFVNFIFIPNN